ncbi:MAG: hypothetical protein V1816_16865 [Pseudomonadota bacterium]
MRFCDLKCPHADFPKDNAVDGSGSCRTFTALYCAILDRLVHKNAPCQAPPEQTGSRPPTQPARKS